MSAHDTEHHAWHSRGQFPETCAPCQRDQTASVIDWMWKDHQCQRPDLEAIVSDLAETDPFRSDMYADPDCMFCRQVAGTDHRPDCEWRRAVEWVRDTDQETP